MKKMDMVLALAVAGGGYYWWKHHKTAAAAAHVGNVSKLN